MEGAVFIGANLLYRGGLPAGERSGSPRGGPAFVIAADKGLVHLEAQGIRPDLIVGDFDSLGRVPAGDNILRHPVEKDDTDTMLAVKTALDRGMGTIVFYGCLGGRLDHTYANLQTLTYLARRGGQGWLLGEGTVVTAVENGRLDLPAGLRGAVSVFCPDGQALGGHSPGPPLPAGELHPHQRLPSGGQQPVHRASRLRLRPGGDPAGHVGRGTGGCPEADLNI